MFQQAVHASAASATCVRSLCELFARAARSIGEGSKLQLYSQQAALAQPASYFCAGRKVRCCSQQATFIQAASYVQAASCTLDGSKLYS